MMFDPLQKEQTQGNSKSKQKSGVSSIVPLTIKQIHTLIQKKYDFALLGKIVILGLVTKIKEMVGRTQVTINDTTGSIIVIEGQRGDEIMQQQYFKFIVTVREDKQEMVLISVGFQKITNFNKIQYHQACIMENAYQNQDLNI